MFYVRVQADLEADQFEPPRKGPKKLEWAAVTTLLAFRGVPFIPFLLISSRRIVPPPHLYLFLSALCRKVPQDVFYKLVYK